MEGSNFSVSIALIACLEVPTNSPNCSCVNPFCSRNTLILFFINLFPFCNVYLTLSINVLLCNVNLTAKCLQERDSQLETGISLYAIMKLLATQNSRIEKSSEAF